MEPLSIRYVLDFMDSFSSREECLVHIRTRRPQMDRRPRATVMKQPVMRNKMQVIVGQRGLQDWYGACTLNAGMDNERYRHVKAV